MADRLAIAIVAAGLLAAGAASAQVSDPMRPPEGVGVADGATAPAASSGVQAVIVRGNGKSVALINGRQVAVGDSVGDKRVVKISEGEVVLKGAGGRETLKVIPAIEKQPAGKASGTRRAAGKIDPVGIK